MDLTINETRWRDEKESCNEVDLGTTNTTRKLDELDQVTNWQQMTYLRADLKEENK